VGGPASFSRDGDLLRLRLCLSADPAEKKVATFVRFGRYHFMDLATRSLGPISDSVVRSGSAPSLCYCVPCLPGQSLALLRVGASALPGASCACVWPPLGTRAVAYCARMEAVAAYISCREKCGPCVDSCRWEWATVSELIGEGNYVCIAMHGS